jgi:hypothetical protein
MPFSRIAIAFVFAGLTASAFAGPDWDVIQRARLAAQHAAANAAKAPPENQGLKGASQAGTVCNPAVAEPNSHESAPTTTSS